MRGLLTLLQMNRYFRLDSADLIVPNQEAWGLLADFQTLVGRLPSPTNKTDRLSSQRELVDTLPGNTPLQNQALTTANAIMNAFSAGSPESITAARTLARGVFGESWEALGARVYDVGPETPLVWGIGHCHIDSAWLWPYSVTQQKVARSWATQVDLMERYPEHRFAASSAQQYMWLEQARRPRSWLGVRELTRAIAVPAAV
jgi:alpha-mannosidase